MSEILGNQRLRSIPNASTDTLFADSFDWIGLPLLLLLVAAVALLPMTWQQQTLFGGMMVVMAIIVGRVSESRIATVTIMLLSMCATARYAVWRVDSLWRFLRAPWAVVDHLDAFLMLLLLSAEMYSFLILYLGFMQTIAPLQRTPVALPEQVDLWPDVDIMIPTFNEPLAVVRYTILAAKQQDWPKNKFRVWVLDDGNRDDFREFAAEAGVGYIARPEHQHAKAGNINYALERTQGELVAIFDCDHVPTRSFLQVTTGWFLRDRNLGMLQTPHHFYSPDPFERNLGNFRRIPSESELFYGIIQDTNDLWNATFFCGSCAVLRRKSIEQVGGIAHETVTEDAHTSLRMQKLRWNTAYINLPQAAGLATETLGGHVRQRVRWARGMTQILRVDNPLFAKGLTFPQRLCYLNAMLHFMYALPRLIFLTAPILYLVFGKLNIPGYWLAILVFAMPHLILANIINSRVQGHKRYSFWNEIYETVLSPYILLPTLFALISPKFGKFNVTAKGQNQQEDSFDSKLARPFLVLLGLNGLALIMAVPRYLYLDHSHPGTVAMNLVWTLFNIVVLTVTLSVCWETRQRRESVRVNLAMPVSIDLGDRVFAGVVRNLSVTGAAISVGGARFETGDRVKITFPIGETLHKFGATVVQAGNGQPRFEFEIGSIEEQEGITRVLYLTADRWLDWTDGRARDSMLSSFGEVLMASVSGFRKMLRLFERKPKEVSLSRSIGVIILAIASPVFAFHQTARAVSIHGNREAAAKIAPTDSVRFDFRSLGARNGLLLDRINRTQAIEVALPDNVLVERGSLRLTYTLPETSEPASTLNVLLNGQLLASITPTASEIASGHGQTVVPLPGDQMIRLNHVTLQLAGAQGGACTTTNSVGGPIEIGADSDLTLDEQRLVLANDLSLLPQPFTQRLATQASQIPVVFGHTPGRLTLQAAGVVASWFGSQAVEGEEQFPVSLGVLPSGNAVVLLLQGEEIDGISAAIDGQPEVQTLVNPVDPYSKVLLLSASSEGQLLLLAQELAAGQLDLTGDHAGLNNQALPPVRLPDDAPRWIHSRRTGLEQISGSARLSTVGESPINVYLRLSPDYDFGVHDEMYLHLAYSNNGTALARQSNIAVRLNGSPANSAPMVAGGTEAKPHEVNVALGDLPVSAFGNTIQVQFYFVPPAGQECEPNRYTASMEGGSFLDLGGVSHLAKLPNLRLFSNAGFPFTRRADLSDTAVLLPHDLSTDQMAEYLNLMAYFGTSTGYPALRMTLGEIGDASRYADKDLLMLGTYADLESIPAVASELPLQAAADGWHLSWRARAVRWVRGLWPSATNSASQASDAEPDESFLSPAGLIESIESPYGSDHSVVLVMARSADLVAAMGNSLAAELPHDEIHGTVSVWNRSGFVGHNFSTPTYRIGDVSLLGRLALSLPQYSIILAPVLLLVCLLLAVWIQASLIVRIRRRLMGAPQAEALFDRGAQYDLPSSTGGMPSISRTASHGPNGAVSGD